MKKNWVLLGTVGFAVVMLFHVGCRSDNDPLLVKNDTLDVNVQFRDTLAEVTAQYTAVPEDAPADTLFFILNSGYSNIKVTSKHLEEFGRVRRSPGLNYLYVKLNKPVEHREKVTVNFSYTIDLLNQNHLEHKWIELNLDALWIPVRDMIGQTFTGTVTFGNLPPGYSIYSKVDVEKTDDGRYRILHEEPTIDYLLLAGNEMESHIIHSDNYPVEVISEQTVSDSLILSMADKVQKSMQTFNETFGVNEPMKEATVILRKVPRSEMGYQYARGNLIVSSPEHDHFGSLSHEVAHYWWNKGDPMDEPWIRESFANYSMFLVMEKFVPDTYKKYIDAYSQRMEGYPSVLENTMFTENSYQVYYYKGAYLLYLLEQRIGRDKMIEFLKFLVDREIDSTSGILNSLEQVTNREDRDYFEALLKQ